MISNKGVCMASPENALISVCNKEGIVEFAQGLYELDVNIFASGGTAKEIAESGVPVTDVAELVGGEAILEHRVVTLSREIHAGLLEDKRNDMHVDVRILVAEYLEFRWMGRYTASIAFETTPTSVQNSACSSPFISCGAPTWRQRKITTE